MAWTPPRTAQPSVTIQFETKEFNQFLTNIIKGLSSTQAAAALLKIAMDAVRGFILKNPVDTGRSRAAWYVANNFLAAKIGGPSMHPAGQAQGQGYAKGAVKAYLSGPKKRIEITNAVEYVGRLEYGWSRQAPYGMVRVTLQMLRGHLPKAIAKQLRAMWKAGGRPRFSEWRASKEGPSVI